LVVLTQLRGRAFSDQPANVRSANHLDAGKLVILQEARDRPSAVSSRWNAFAALKAGAGSMTSQRMFSWTYAAPNLRSAHHPAQGENGVNVMFEDFVSPLM
jgi:hypothetical protein